MTISKETLIGLLTSSFALGMLVAIFIIFIGMAIRFKIEGNRRRKNIDSWIKEIENDK